MITLNKGHIFKLVRKFSKDEVLNFGKLTGDFNPIHSDEEFCKNTIFGKPIVYGMLGASLFGNLLGNNITGGIYLKQDLKFLKPVFIDEEVEASVKIEGIIMPKGFMELTTLLRKIEGDQIAIEGKALVKIPLDKYRII